MRSGTLVMPIRKVGKRTYTLLGFKTRKVARHKWTPPGGKLTPSDKTLKHCAQRELKEETGIICSLCHLVRVGTLLGCDEISGERWNVGIFAVDTRHIRGILKKRSKEFSKIHWFAKSRLPTKKIIPSDLSWLNPILNGKKVKVIKRKHGTTTTVTATIGKRYQFPNHS